jgi:hypothetical protein
MSAIALFLFGLCICVGMCAVVREFIYAVRNVIKFNRRESLLKSSKKSNASE